MIRTSLLLIGKIVSICARFFLRRSGGTWPGEIVYKIYPTILGRFFSEVSDGIVLITGTNGKTTTSAMIRQIVHEGGTIPESAIVHNVSGANLVNGIVSAFLYRISVIWKRSIRYAILEVDENAFPHVLRHLSELKYQLKSTKIIIIFLNLFRDQLDRYGEVDSIKEKWRKSLLKLSDKKIPNISILANGDDPSLVGILSGLPLNIHYFGLPGTQFLSIPLPHTADAVYCSKCGNTLTFSTISFAHLGDWHCAQCGFKRPNIHHSDWPLPLPGKYNEYNARASAEAGCMLGLSNAKVSEALKTMKPAFGRLEDIFYKDTHFKLLLAKNPAGFDAALMMVLSLSPRYLLLALNDRIPDGRDVSWIWDTDAEAIPSTVRTITTGDRAYDMGVRMKYACQLYQDHDTIFVIPDLKEAILSCVQKDHTVYVLATYSAMLEIRKLLTGRKIL